MSLTVLSPSCDAGHACPEWMRISSPRCFWQAVPTADLVERSRAVTPPSGYMRPSDAAGHVGRTASYIDKGIMSGRIPAVWVKRTRFVRLEDVEAYSCVRHAERAETKRLRAELSKRNKAKQTVKARVSRRTVRTPEQLAESARMRRERNRRYQAARRAQRPKVAPEPIPEGYLPLDAVAARYGYSLQYLYRICIKGELPSRRVNRKYVVRPVDVANHKHAAEARMHETNARNAAKARAARMANLAARAVSRV